MGTDPQTSVAGPWGELHDTRACGSATASAFPTSSGTNPMITIMALAHRTAEAIAAAAPSGAGLAGRDVLVSAGDPDPSEVPNTMAVAEQIQVRDKLYIGGDVGRPGRHRRRSTSSTPRPRRSWGAIPEGTPEDVDRAVAAARAAFESWSQTRRRRARRAARRRSPPASRRAPTRSPRTVAHGAGHADRAVAHDPGRRCRR